MSGVGDKIVKMHTKGYLEKEIKNIEYVIPSNILKNIIFKISNNEITIQEVSEQYGFSAQAFNFIYLKYTDSLDKNDKCLQTPMIKVSQKKDETDQYYDTDSIIKSLQVSKKDRKIVITYLNDTREMVDYNNETYRLYKQQILNDAKNLVDTIENHIAKNKGVSKIKPSNTERLLYLKSKKFLLMKVINDAVMTYCKEYDSENYDIMKGISITYKKVNCLEYSSCDLNKDAEKIQTYYNRNIKKQSK